MPRAGTRTRTAPGCRITAAICLDGAEPAATQAVESLIQQSLPKDAYEVLLIGDAEVIWSAAPSTAAWATIPNLRQIEDRVADVTEARNLALRLSQSPLIAFLDPRATADPGWLASLCRTFEQFGEIARAVGGRVRPVWEVPRPSWLGDELLTELSLLDLGDEARFLGAGERLSTVNIALRKASVEAQGGFRSAADGTPAGAAIALRDVQEPIDQITTSVGRAIYDPLAAVDYLIPANRLRQQWFRSNAAWQAVRDLARAPSPSPAALAERWESVKDFFFECPPSERTIRGLVLEKQDPQRFRAQIAAIYDGLFCLLSGISETDYD
jgi:glucosyl-dolichyl phosphate glucuronosyltransferase